MVIQKRKHSGWLPVSFPPTLGFIDGALQVAVLLWYRKQSKTRVNGLEQASTPMDNARPVAIGPGRYHTTEQGLLVISVMVSRHLAPSFTTSTVIPTHVILLQGFILRSLTAWLKGRRMWQSSQSCLDCGKSQKTEPDWFLSLFKFLRPSCFLTKIFKWSSPTFHLDTFIQLHIPDAGVTCVLTNTEQHTHIPWGVDICLGHKKYNQWGTAWGWLFPKATGHLDPQIAFWYLSSVLWYPSCRHLMLFVSFHVSMATPFQEVSLTSWSRPPCFRSCLNPLGKSNSSWLCIPVPWMILKISLKLLVPKPHWGINVFLP